MANQPVRRANLRDWHCHNEAIIFYFSVHRPVSVSVCGEIDSESHYLFLLCHVDGFQFKLGFGTTTGWYWRAGRDARTLKKSSLNMGIGIESDKFPPRRKQMVICKSVFSLDDVWTSLDRWVILIFFTALKENLHTEGFIHGIKVKSWRTKCHFRFTNWLGTQLEMFYPIIVSNSVKTCLSRGFHDCLTWPWD